MENPLTGSVFSTAWAELPFNATRWHHLLSRGFLCALRKRVPSLTSWATTILVKHGVFRILSPLRLPRVLLSHETRFLCFEHQDTGSIETQGSPNEKRLGDHRAKKKFEVSLPKHCTASEGISGDTYLMLQGLRFLLLAQQVHRVSHFDSPWVFQDKILSKERRFSI